jgi:hypothetical protein
MQVWVWVVETYISMISSIVLPKVIFNRAPKATPIFSEMFSVALVRIPVRGTMAMALRMKITF